MFEYNSSAIKSAASIDNEPGWLSYLIKPMIMIVLIGGTCYISINTVKRKKSEKASAPRGFKPEPKSGKGGSMFGKSSGGAGKSSRGGSAFGGRKR